MNTIKLWTLTGLLILSVFVDGCVVASETTKGEVNAQCQMSEEEKEAFAEMVAQKVVELQRQ
jgi:hypothetical protein